ncbi:MAG: 16S rRNA (guanine(527)-N(7))-methyltransferase RsmG [Spirochaetales bacterium]|jgi:16S rRNA (guanine527-N7)-methyltransferase|nr:16S rRNA (guanine(527)-N(7))-methyltransferase RsmG [Spirochaetales bacterium]
MFPKTPAGPGPGEALREIQDRVLSPLDFPLPPGLGEALSRYVDELLLFNPLYGLVGTGASPEDPRKELLRHLADCLAPGAIFQSLEPRSLADVGTGAGLPGIPLALLLDSCRVTLVEAKGRRCDFLRNASALLGLAGRVEIFQGPLKELPGSFDVVTCRAFAPLDREGKNLLKIVRPGGKLAAYKGREEVFAGELEGLGGYSVERLRHPLLTGERALVLIDKG